MKFSVTLHKGPESVLVACVGLPELQVIALRHLDSEDEIPEDALMGVDPDLLPEGSQQAVLSYLDLLGVNNNLSYFVSAYALLKQNTEKLEFVRRATSFMRGDASNNNATGSS